MFWKPSSPRPFLQIKKPWIECLQFFYFFLIFDCAFLTVLRSLFVANFACFNLSSDIVPESLLKSSGVK